MRLPCNPIFPVGPVYLADHLHKQFPSLPQQLLDLAAVPVLDVKRVLRDAIEACRPTLLVFSWRDIQIYAPVDGRGGNPLQNSFEVFYARHPLRRLRGALGGVQLMAAYYGELVRNMRLIRRGLRWARRHQPQARAVLGGATIRSPMVTAPSPSPPKASKNTSRIPRVRFSPRPSIWSTRGDMT